MILNFKNSKINFKKKKSKDIYIYIYFKAGLSLINNEPLRWTIMNTT